MVVWSEIVGRCISLGMEEAGGRGGGGGGVVWLMNHGLLGSSWLLGG